MASLTATASGLEQMRGDFSTVCDGLDYAALGQSGINFFSTDGALLSSLTYREVRERALDLAGRLAGFAPRNTRIGLLAETTEEFAVAFYACQYAGLIPAPLNLPAAFSGREIYEWQVRRMVTTAHLTAVMTSEALRGIITAALADTDVPVVAISGADLPTRIGTLAAHGADDICYIQFSSGSTSEPKGVVVSQRGVTANCRAMLQNGLQAGPSDRAVSWLPLYHDMGLVGFFIGPMLSQVSVDYLSTTSFARRPGTWLKLISENGGTVSYSPSFGYELSALRYRGESLDLSHWRVAGIGGDMVRYDTLASFHDTFGPCGFDPKAFVSSYGLAEATLGVSMAPLGRGLRTDTVDLVKVQSERRAIPIADAMQENRTRTFVSCGYPLSNLEVKIVDDRGNCLSDRHIGRILARGPSITRGYFRAPDAVIPATDADGWLDTGDLGYWLDGEIFVSGRSKELILWNGRNIWPQDIEWVAQKVGQADIARCAAFEIPDENDNARIVLLAECRSRDAERREVLLREIAAAARAAAGAPVSVEFVGLRALPLTSSGKLSRVGARSQYLQGCLSMGWRNDAAAVSAAG